jgi:hypothetical protein
MYKISFNFIGRKIVDSYSENTLMALQFLFSTTFLNILPVFISEFIK